MTSARIAPLPTGDLGESVDVIDVIRVGGQFPRQNRKPLYHFTIESESATRARVCLAGEIDLLAAADLRATLEAVSASTRQVTVDLSEVTFINSRAVGILVEHSSTQPCRIRVCGASRSTRLLFELFGAAEMLSGDLRTAR
ncbi:STAS domain-containing protein [Gordonia sp. OPL2]|uniref:STAS domain-containing protein n=1 Tax=Gordonia sp. OPL2 TaxID=2486274 RepID=UPI001655EC00|nr:STAS domain-containing protein [Gordonia sp. OPL2]ROZ88961.1 anti-sigma factor antagonist [Gordonia sp. OPL2]